MSPDRPTGFDLGRIPFATIDRWAERNGITDTDEFDDFARLIRSMDAAYVEKLKPKT